MNQISRLHLIPYVCQICGKHKPLWKLANSNLSSFGEFYQHLIQVCPSFTTTTGEPSFPRKLLARICGKQKHLSCHLYSSIQYNYRICSYVKTVLRNSELPSTYSLQYNFESKLDETEITFLSLGSLEYRMCTNSKLAGKSERIYLFCYNLCRLSSAKYHTEALTTHTISPCDNSLHVLSSFKY